MPRHNMPDNWEPPVPAWSANFGGSPSLAVAYCGLQSHTGDIADTEAAFALVRSGPDSPDHVERGPFKDVAGIVNQIFVCYWRDSDTYVRFAEQSAFARWLADDALLTSDVGVWVEAFCIPMRRFETMFSSEIPAGAAKLAAKPMTGPIDEHGYWGGMRDRIPASDTHDLSNPLNDIPSMVGRTETRGRCLVLAAPENLCLIRSAQDWSSCRGDERNSYLNDIHPVLTKGMKFLMENPAETGCLTCRLIEQLTDNVRSRTRASAWPISSTWPTSKPGPKATRPTLPSSIASWSLPNVWATRLRSASGTKSRPFRWTGHG